MKKIILFSIFILLCTTSFAGRNASAARRLLDRVAASVTSRGGASAQFTLTNPNVASVSGTIAIKGNKFNAHTPKAIVWYDGKTQWTYLQSTNEVNITYPKASAQAKMNPYAFLTLYKSGYDLSMSGTGNLRTVTLKALKGQALSRVVIVVNQLTAVPTSIKLLENGRWTTITLRNFKAKAQPDAIFTFNAKDFPKAEIVDLR